MENERILEAWELEKERLASLGHEWSMADAMRFSIQLAQSRMFRDGPEAFPANG